MIRQRLFTQFVRNNKVAESIYKEDKLELPGSPFHSERKTPTQLYRNSTHQTKTVFDTDLVLTVGHSELTKIQLKKPRDMVFTRKQVYFENRMELSVRENGLVLRDKIVNQNVVDT